MKNCWGKYFIIQWLGCDRYYVYGTYCGRIRCGEHKIDMIRFDNEQRAQKYLAKLQKIDAVNKMEIRQLA